MKWVTLSNKTLVNIDLMAGVELKVYNNDHSTDGLILHLSNATIEIRYSDEDMTTAIEDYNKLCRAVTV